MMPQMAVPSTPMPVHTAYTVPIGNVRAASDMSPKLMSSASIVGIVGSIFVNPFEYLNPMGHATSSSPAMTSNNQSMLTPILMRFV